MQKYVTEAHQNVKGTEAINHKHFGVGHLGLKAVGNGKAFKNVSRRAAKISDTFY
jgi:hypothetical protein